MGVDKSVPSNDELPCVTWVRSGYPCKSDGPYVHHFVRPIRAARTRTPEGTNNMFSWCITSDEPITDGVWLNIMESLVDIPHVGASNGSSRLTYNVSTDEWVDTEGPLGVEPFTATMRAVQHIVTD